MSTAVKDIFNIVLTYLAYGDNGVFIATLLLAFIAWLQLSQLNKTSKSEFIHKFKNDFFTDKTRILIALFDNELLKFDQAGECFKLAGRVKRPLKADIIHVFSYVKTEYSFYDVDDLLLGHFEDLGLYEKKGIVGIDMVYETYSWYIETCWKNDSIKKYIQSQLDDEGEDVYDHFKYIYDKCKSYGEAKNKHGWLWLWKVRWWIKECILRI